MLAHASTEAKRQGFNVTLHNAGWYRNVSRQLAQSYSCMASDVDAIVVGLVAEARFSKKLKQAWRPARR